MKVFEYPFAEGTGPTLGVLAGEVAEAGLVGFVSGSYLLGSITSARICQECIQRGFEADYAFANLPECDVFVVFRGDRAGGEAAAVDECVREALGAGLLEGAPA